MVDIKLQDDGQGPYIKEWNLEVPQPTMDELNAAYTDPSVQQQWALEQNRIANLPIIAQLDALDLQSIRAIRAKDEGRIAALELQAALLREQLK